MPDPSLLGVWVRRFLLEHLVSERNLARNTQQSYRDTLALLLPFAATQRKRAVDRLLVCDLSSDTLKRFLDSLERQRQVLDPYAQSTAVCHPCDGTFHCRAQSRAH